MKNANFLIFRKNYNDLLQRKDQLEKSLKSIVLNQIIMGIGVFGATTFTFLIQLQNYKEQILKNLNLLFSLGFLFLGIYLCIMFTVILFAKKEYQKNKKELSDLKEKITILTTQNHNYKEWIKPLEKWVINLKFKINLTNVQNNSFANSISQINSYLTTNVLNQDLEVLDNKIACILYTVFKKENNGSNTRLILDTLSKDQLFQLLYYVVMLGKSSESILFDLDVTSEEFEETMVDLKKIIESKIVYINNEELKEETHFRG